MPDSRWRLGVDIGGTFTDIVLIDDDGTLSSKKLLSTPRDYSVAIEEGVSALIRELGIAPGEIREFVHATTVATNAIIERKGVSAALVTTKGFRDVLELGRFRTPRLYDITFRKPEPLIERRLRFEASERTSADGEILSPVDDAELDGIAAACKKEGVQALAVTFINSYVNSANELHAADYLAKRLPGISVSASVRLLPQLGEYERTSTTVINAYVRPVIERYIDSLHQRMEKLGIQAPLMIMQSSGGISPASLVAERPVYVMESGPAAGVLGGSRVAERVGVRNLIVFDMGGTTAKATIVEAGQFALCPETEVGGGAALGSRMVRGSGYPVQVPTIDIAEVGAGGGSIAMIDAAGGIQVGPHSAGAEPGPVCYNRGGVEPTVTDANLILGYLNPASLVGGELTLDYRKAEETMNRFADRLGMSSIDVAYGVHLIANATMLRALRGVSSEKGMDPALFALFAIGGNGPVHAATLADSLGMTRIIVPPVAGLFSALGMLFADVEHQLVAAFYRRFGDITVEDLNNAALPLAEEGEKLLRTEGYAERRQREVTVYADVKYVGQTSPLSIALREFPAAADELTMIAKAFGEEHLKTFGYVSEREPLQIVSLKAVCRGIPDAPRMPERMSHDREKTMAASSRKAYFGPDCGWVETPVASRASLQASGAAGPLIVEEYDSTTVVPPGWAAKRDALNNIVLERL